MTPLRLQQRAIFLGLQGRVRKWDKVEICLSNGLGQENKKGERGVTRCILHLSTFFSWQAWVLAFEPHRAKISCRKMLL